MTPADRVRARLLQLIAGASDDDLFKINNTLAEAGHLDLSRCNKLGLPFPLFDLPLELLEHSAHYLSRREAASMLTFNRLLHDVFSRVVWRSIRTSWIKKSKIQLSALNRYGHLVNQLYIDEDRFTIKRIASLMPNVMTVSIYNNKSGSKILAGQLDLLHNLRKVTISVNPLSRPLFGSLGDWINSDSLSGHVTVIELKFLNVEEWPTELLSLYGSVINKKRIQISLATFKRIIPERHLVDMAPSLTKLEFMFSACSGRYFDSIYRTSNATFPFVTCLKLVACCAGRKESSLLGMTPERFPSVRTLSLDIYNEDCISQNSPALPIMLSRPWPSVASLKLVGYVKQDDHKYIASAFPNLITLDYASGADPYYLARLLPKFKFLQVLTLRYGYIKPYIGQSSTIIMPSMVMNRLRSMKLRELALTTDMVRFIYHCCPNLVELEISDCTLSREAVKYANKISKTMKSQVRHLRLKAYIENQLDLWVEFISKFKNLKEIMVDNGCDGAYYLKVMLTERFPYTKIELYQG